MKILSPHTLLSPSILLAWAPISHAAIAVSNLGNADAGSWIVGNGVGADPSDTPIATSFMTGTGASWTLNKLTLFLIEDVNVSGSVTVELFSDNAGEPGSSISVLNGPDPSGDAPANYEYTPGAAVSLGVGTTYWVVVSGPLEGGFPDSYGWTYTGDTNESTALPSWSIGNTSLRATTGNSSATWNNWNEVLADNPTMFSVDVTAVPEPTSALLLALGSGFLLCRRRK